MDISPKSTNKVIDQRLTRLSPAIHGEVEYGKCLVCGRFHYYMSDDEPS